jgi:RNA polymerase sigma-70 factor (ECF subfamily)
VADGQPAGCSSWSLSYLTTVTSCASTSCAEEALLAVLPSDLSHAVRARVLDELEYGEIARGLDLSEQVVRKRVSRGLTRLRARLQEDHP